MLELWPVMSPHAHARILRRDATKARAVPGVAAVLFASDIPGDNDVGAVRHDETLLAADEALFHGHMVAVVVADSYEIARKAAALVEVEYEPLPAVLGSTPPSPPRAITPRGTAFAAATPTAALAAAPRTLSGALTIGGQEHFYLESQAAWAEVLDDDSVHVSSSTQHPSEIQAVVSHVLGLARNRVVVESPRMGGGFGGKETQGNTWAALVALAAVKTRRPVRVMLDRDLDMQLTGKRHPTRADWRVGFDDEGTLLAFEATLVSDGGWALDLSESINDRALFHIDNAYYLPNVNFFGRVAKTNTVSHTAFRGFGGPQGVVVIEEVIDRVARACGLRPEVVRERNFYRGEGETNTTHYGQHIDDNRIAHIWNALGVRRLSTSAAPRSHGGTPSTLGQARPRDHAGEVRHLVHGELPQPGGRLRADVPRRLGAGEPRRNRDGPGAPHQAPGRRDARARAHGRPRQGDEDPDRQGAQHLGHGGLGGRRPQRRGRAQRVHARSARGSSTWPRGCSAANPSIGVVSPTAGFADLRPRCSPLSRSWPSAPTCRRCRSRRRASTARRASATTAPWGAESPFTTTRSARR